MPPGLDSCRSLLAYAGAGRELLARLKYRNARSAVAWLADGMAGLAEPDVVDTAVITWAPTTDERRRRRSFDQAEVLARAVAQRLGRPARPLLVRTGGGASTGRSALERRANAPCYTTRRHVPGAVILVDDVVTTGTTLMAAAVALRIAGTTRINALTAARTPLKVISAGTDA